MKQPTITDLIVTDRHAIFKINADTTAIGDTLKIGRVTFTVTEIEPEDEDDLEPLTCGCLLGSHPPIHNYLAGAAERDGAVCALGWNICSCGDT